MAYEVDHTDFAIHPEEFVSVAEAAKTLQVSLPTIKRWIRDGRLHAYHLGPRYVRIRRSDLAGLLEPIQPAGKGTPGKQPSRIAATSTFSIERLSKEEIEAGLAAMKRAESLRKQMGARRGGRPLDSSTEIIHEMREERSRRYE